MCIMRSMKAKKANQLKDNIITVRCDAQLKQAINAKATTAGIGSDSDAIRRLAEAWIAGDIVYKNYRFVAK